MDTKRHLKKFENQNAYESQKDEVMGNPHVVLLGDTKELVYASASNDPFNGYEYVDLGLPSGTLWATSVLSNADGEPLYFQWGDTEGWTAEQIQNKEKEFDGGASDYKWHEGEMHCDGSSMTKYNATDGKTVLDLEDDAAHVHMGGEWHMPTKEQLEELIANTTSDITTKDGVSGQLLTASNGNSLFIPYAGHVMHGDIYEFMFNCYVWSNSIGEELLGNAWYMELYSMDMHTVSRVSGNFALGVVG